MNAYCLFCNSSKRNDLAERIRQLFHVEVVAPKIIQRKWIKGKAFGVSHDYLPGYLFIYADDPITDISTLVYLKDVHRVLGDRDNGYNLMGSDLAFARMLWEFGARLAF